MAEAAHRVSISKFQSRPSDTVLVSSVGDDSLGRLLLEEMRRIGMRTNGVISCGRKSAVCNMVLDGSGNLIGGVADMDIVHSIEPEMVGPIPLKDWGVDCRAQVISRVVEHGPTLVAMDANVSPAVLKALVQHCNANNIQSECVMSYGVKAITDVSFMCHSIFVSLLGCFNYKVFFDALQRAHFRSQVHLYPACHRLGPRIRYRRFPNQNRLSEPLGISRIVQMRSYGTLGTNGPRLLVENRRQILDRSRISLITRPFGA